MQPTWLGGMDGAGCHGSTCCGADGLGASKPAANQGGHYAQAARSCLASSLWNLSKAHTELTSPGSPTMWSCPSCKPSTLLGLPVCQYQLWDGGLRQGGDNEFWWPNREALARAAWHGAAENGGPQTSGDGGPRSYGNSGSTIVRLESAWWQTSLPPWCLGSPWGQLGCSIRDLG
eukprot:3808985-Rhodomonas_salina.4